MGCSTAACARDGDYHDAESAPAKPAYRGWRNTGGRKEAMAASKRAAIGRVEQGRVPGRVVRLGIEVSGVAPQ